MNEMNTKSGTNISRTGPGRAVSIVLLLLAIALLCAALAWPRESTPPPAETFVSFNY